MGSLHRAFLLIAFAAAGQIVCHIGYMETLVHLHALLFMLLIWNRNRIVTRWLDYVFFAFYI